ncbi:patatin-like phospholipase family protein [Dactylosporangium sucinum]|uniref:Phospholipase n=1 Tax=Dactylosporangium sucinum TaxID=1424081 RepID=A0A917WGQ6_9ACTN|nr:patatin-like phospholipase family protein [Dactylosporangium sucinum]GGM02766.1 phospholipase [Dactylosporangium sucinum]
MSGTARVGLVLAGGGAKGAYQAGVVEYLASREIEVAAVAGTSIGALNGAVVAAADTIAAAADRLSEVWDEIERVGASPAALPAPPPRATLADLLAMADSPVLRPGFVDAMVERYVDAAAFARPFWVTAFPGVRPGSGRLAPDWLLDLARSATGTPSAWLRVDTMPLQLRHQAVLASAALPYFAPGRWVGGTFYRDGGLGGIPANTPAGPLVAYGDFDLIIVTQLTRGVLWDAHDYPRGRFLELRPGEALSAPGLAGTAAGLLDFSPQRLRRLRRQGFEDARRDLGRAEELLRAVHDRRSAQEAMLDSLDDL